MSVCSPCFDSGIQVAYCNGGISFGYVTPETVYTVTLRHNATNRVQTFSGIESDVDGLLTITGASIDNGQGYTIRLMSCEQFTICETAYDCISFSVANVDSDTEEPPIVNLMECVVCGG
jgi:hypothetical protein